MLYPIFIALVLLSGCGYFKKHEEAAPLATPKLAALTAKYAADLATLKAQSDPETGWPDPEDCDGTLWAGEALAAGDNAVKIDLAEGSTTTGIIGRSPKNPCTPASRDMALGYAFGRWHLGDLGALERLADYAEAHSWSVSDDHALGTLDVISRGTLGRAIRALSHGSDARGYADNAFACLVPAKDFEEHLEVLLNLLNGEVADVLEGQTPGPSLIDLPGGCVDTLKNLAANNPNDALFQAAAAIYTGDFTAAIDLVLEPNYLCPSYVRGSSHYCLVHTLLAEHTILKRFQGNE